MNILYCSHPLDPKQVDVDYAAEQRISDKLGFSSWLFSYDEFIECVKPVRALKNIPVFDEVQNAIYRGWMMSPDQYQKLYDRLAQKRLLLVNSPEEYRFCHHLPASYETLKEHTPRSLWLSNEESEGFAIGLIMDRLSTFGQVPLVLKDYVKSQKHYWREACYIPDASDSSQVERVTRKFLELQRNKPEGGLVFREFVEFQSIGRHSKSGMPLTCEYRLFFLYGTLVAMLRYWDEGAYDIHTPPLEVFQELATRIKSNFFTMDIAKKRDGEWLVVELGDGQVAGLPEHANIREFYEQIQMAT